MTSMKNKGFFFALFLTLLLTTAVWAQPSPPTATSAMTGRIAYAGLDANGKAISIRAINPDGSQPETLYTLQGAGEISDVAWHPNGSEIAFLSSEEAAYSLFFQDVFAVNILSKQVRRISNPPRFTGLPGSYATGKVRGTLRNNAGVNNISIISLYVQGATSGVQIPLFNILDQVPFEVDVADLGPGVQQYIFISWSHTSGGPYKEIVATPIDVQAGQTVDVGLIDFVGTTSQPKLSDLSWNGDGSLAGVLLENGATVPWGFTGTGQTFGSSLGDVGFISTVALSPAGNLMAYYKVTGAEGKIALNNVGGTSATEQIILNDTTASLNYDRHIAWLPDGSGLVITVNGEIYDYILATAQVRQLTNFGGGAQVDRVTASPDGRYVAFSYSPNLGQSDIYILDRQALTITPLTTDGRSAFPSWSRGDVAVTQTVFLPMVIR
ncbi:MAG: hypothetical protein Kow0080_01110 [Candidatus Promineifilaceae bacterium]